MPSFLITIDTEGDDLWSRPRTIETRNAAFLPRFQRLCEEFGFKPTWLTNFEMANCPGFVAFGRAAAQRGAAEIGMHLHAWNSPPLVPLTDDDFFHQPFLVEFPADLVEAKISLLTALLRDRFEGPIVSHRAGRWALDATYARLLVRQGYRVDCSVTPHVSWAGSAGAPGGAGGSDYRHFPSQPYFMDLDHIHRADRSGTSPLLELPVSVIPSTLSRWAPWAYETRGLRRWAWRQAPRQLWLYPDGRNLGHLLRVADEAVGAGRPCLELVMHSSDLMPGGGPVSPDEAAVERLYRDLLVLFKRVSAHFTGATLSEFRQTWLTQGAPRPQMRAEWAT